MTLPIWLRRRDLLEELFGPDIQKEIDKTMVPNMLHNLFCLTGASLAQGKIEDAQHYLFNAVYFSPEKLKKATAQYIRSTSVPALKKVV